MKYQNTQVYKTAPSDFAPRAQAASCLVNVNGKYLLLQLAAHKPEPGKWGLPGGKIEPNEEPKDAALRELFEETRISPSGPIDYAGTFYIRKPEVDYIFHVFSTNFDQEPQVHLSDEHTHYQWICKTNLATLPLMDGAQEILNLL